MRFKRTKSLADYVHSKGLRFGIHIMRGIPRRAVEANLPIEGSRFHAADVADKQPLCSWNTDMYGVDTGRPGGQDYYDSIARLYASWGLDFVKADDMFTRKGDHSSEFAALRTALDKTGRPVVLSLSPGTNDTSKAAVIEKDAQMWRISNDLWDRWVDVKAQFGNFRLWNPYLKPGHWPDGDMLPLGHIGIRAERGQPRMSLLTHDEERTLMMLWFIARSPLMFGGNLPDNDEFTLSLMKNDEALALDQKATASRELFAKGNQIGWVSETAGSSAKYIALFNIGDHEDEDVQVAWQDLDLAKAVMVHDVWTGADKENVRDGQTFHLKPHSSGLYKLTPAAVQ